jgi:anti-sigma factor (TIGR02949 family)
VTGRQTSGPSPEQKDECANALSKLYEFLDQELVAADADDIRQHLAACEPCLDTYDAEQALKQLVKRGCAGEAAPEHLKAKVMQVIASKTVVERGNIVETSTSIEIREY